MTAYSVIKAIFRTIFILLNNLYAIPTHLLWMAILQPLLIHCPNLYNTLEGIGYSTLLHMVAFWSWTAGYTVAEAGDDVSDLIDSECLVISNHQSTADVPMLMYLCTNASKRTLGRNIYWIMDVLFKFTNFGWVSTTHGDFFIRQGRETRQMQLAELRDHIQQVYIPRDRTWILLFPEGGFLYKRKDASQAYAIKNGYPVLEHVTLPRVGAMLTIMQALSGAPSPSLLANNGNADVKTIGDGDSLCHAKKEKSLKWIIDLTIAYPKDNPMDLLCIVFGNREPCQTVIYFRRYKVEDVPHTEEALLHWMYDRWAEKDKLLAHFYETGKFPESPTANGDAVKQNGEPRVLKLNTARCCLVHVLYCLSTCIQLGMIYNVISSIFNLLS